MLKKQEVPDIVLDGRLTVSIAINENIYNHPQSIQYPESRRIGNFSIKPGEQISVPDIRFGIPQEKVVLVGRVFFDNWNPAENILIGIIKVNKHNCNDAIYIGETYTGTEGFYFIDLPEDNYEDSILYIIASCLDLNKLYLHQYTFWYEHVWPFINDWLYEYQIWYNYYYNNP